MTLAPGGYDIPSGDTKPKSLLVGKKELALDCLRMEWKLSFRICVVGFSS
jgi:hypothetical protein